MRTTLEIPDSLFDRAKRAALERKTTLRALVASGLEKELGLSPGASRHRMTKPPVSLGADSPLRRDPVIDDNEEAAREAEEMNEVYRRR